MEKKNEKMYLPSLDDLFSNQKTRDEADLEKVVNIKLSDIDDFPEHPFKVIVNDELKDMATSIKEKGVLSPALVRKKDNGKYEMISGHRRKKASELANMDTIPCIVRDLTDDEATIIMVDSNLQREKVLPSEKAFAYKMKLDALSHQGKRNDLTSVEIAQKSKTSRQVIAEQVGESEDKIRRYIRLTYLLPKLLEYVDNSVLKDKEKLSIALSPAVESCGFFESIPLWAVTLIGGLFITVLSFIMILTVYGRFFKLYLYTAIAPIPLSTFAGEPTQQVGKSFLKSFTAVCLEGAIIVLSCIIFSLFASSPPVVDTNAAAVTQVWKYIGELVFNMLVLVGTIKMSDRVVREMMGL